MKLIIYLNVNVRVPAHCQMAHDLYSWRPNLSKVHQMSHFKISISI